VDKTAKAGTPCTYMVTSAEWSRLESSVSSPVILVTGQNGGASSKPLREGLSGWDKTPPEPPADLKVEKAGPGQYRLTWKASTAADLRYYNVYASTQGKPAIEQKRLLVSPPAGETAYLDWTAPASGAVHYALVAVDRQGNASTPVLVSVE
jgi:fibronectin type 3 domain-containing protein